MRRLMQIFLASLLFVLFLIPGVAFAHTSFGGSSGLMHGFLHPLSGLDHQLAMIFSLASSPTGLVDARCVSCL